MQFPDASFDVVIDKGGLDALMGEESEESTGVGQKLLAGVSRVTSPGGVYLCVTLAQSQVLSMPSASRHCLKYFLPLNTIFSCHQIQKQQPSIFIKPYASSMDATSLQIQLHGMIGHPLWTP